MRGDRRVNVQLEVPEWLYEQVIVPARANRRLNALLVKLLDTYVQDPYVGAKVDGEFAQNDLYTEDALQALLVRAQGNLRKVESLSDQHSEVIESGLGYIHELAETGAPTSPFVERLALEAGDKVPTTKVPQDNSRIARLESQLQTLTDMVTQLVSQGTATPAPVTESLLVLAEDLPQGTNSPVTLDFEEELPARSQPAEELESALPDDSDFLLDNLLDSIG